MIECFCGKPIESLVLHPAGRPTYCSDGCRLAAILYGIEQHLDVLATATTDLSFLYGERR